MGAPWGPFHDVRKVWDEFFGRKPYRAHSMGIASKFMINLPLLTLHLVSKALEPQLQRLELHPITVLRIGAAVKQWCHEDSPRCCILQYLSCNIP